MPPVMTKTIMRNPLFFELIGIYSISLQQNNYSRTDYTFKRIQLPQMKRMMKYTHAKTPIEETPP